MNFSSSTIQSVHPSEMTEGYPRKIANELVSAAMLKIPGANTLIEKINNPKPKMMDVLNGLTPHQYHSNGTLQFGGFG